jgi:hypothetical protein
MIDPLHTTLATALSTMPCTCIEVGSWPLFKSETKAHKPRTCSRCAAIQAYELRKAAADSIAQTTKEQK